MTEPGLSRVHKLVDTAAISAEQAINDKLLHVARLLCYHARELLAYSQMGGIGSRPDFVGLDLELSYGGGDGQRQVRQLRGYLRPADPTQPATAGGECGRGAGAKGSARQGEGSCLPQVSCLQEGSLCLRVCSTIFNLS